MHGLAQVVAGRSDEAGFGLGGAFRLFFAQAQLAGDIRHQGLQFFLAPLDPLANGAQGAVAGCQRPIGLGQRRNFRKIIAFDALNRRVQARHVAALPPQGAPGDQAAHAAGQSQ